jgi:hypothetical protein
MRPILALLLLAAAIAAARAEPQPVAAPAGETPDQALCRMIDAAADRHALPRDFFTRLIWRESSFRSEVVSYAGAQGIAQFMPSTAAERGLIDPFDPEQAIPASAHFLAELNRRFGSLGLAAAAYNAGPTRVADWLSGRRRGLPAETEDYVMFITGQAPDAYRGENDPAISRPPPPGANAEPASSCLTLAAKLRRGTPTVAIAEAAFAPWGVQLAGGFSKARALSSFGRAQQRYAKVLAGIRPMVIGTRLRSRGTRVFYRIRAPAPTRAEAAALCNRIRGVGGACIVLKS